MKKDNNTQANPQEKNKGKKTIWDSRQFNIILSLVLALAIWTYVTTVKDPDQTRRMDKIPVDFSYASEVYTAKELDIVNNPELNVTVRLKGDGANVNSIKPEDIIVYPDYSLVMGPGEVSLPLQVRFTDSRKGRDIEAICADEAKLVFDLVEEKSFDVQVVMDKDQLTVADGYVLNGLTATPGKVTVQGPKSEIDRIDRIVARVKPGGPDVQSSLQNMSDSKLVTASLEAWDKNDQPVELKYSVMDNTLVDVNISVYRTKELPLKVNFINVSPDYDLSNLKYTLSQETMTVTGKPAVVENLTELMVSDFDLGNSFELDKVFQLNVELPKGVSSKDNLNTVTLTFDTQNLTSKKLTVDNIRVINRPAGIKITPLDSKVSNVTLIGPKEELEKLTASNIVAQIDASAAQIKEGTENLAVRIQIPAFDKVFAVGSYTVECSVGADGGKN